MANLPKPNNIVEIKTDLDTDFFYWWCTFLKPVVSLTSKETMVMAEFLKQRYELSKCISDPAILDAVTMNRDTKRKVIEKCGLSTGHFYVIFNKLKKGGIIIDNVINPRLIPNIKSSEGTEIFQLTFLFNMKKEEEKKKKNGK